MAITFCPQPIPVIVEGLGDGYLLYVKDNGMFMNDEFCIVLKEGGRVVHATTRQFRIATNESYQIQKDGEFKHAKKIKRMASKKKKWPKYRVSPFEPFGLKGYYRVEQKRWLFGAWYHVDKSTQESFDEAAACKTLLENGESLYHPMKPIERCKLLGLQLNP